MMHSCVPFWVTLHLTFHGPLVFLPPGRTEDPMPDKRSVVPETLPILPVRDTVLFPGAILPLTVGRESSLALVNSLSDDEKYLGVVAQLDPRIEDPAAADLHKVGTF